MLENKFSFQLIDNTYDVEDTEKLISKLIKEKIDVIGSQIESLENRFALNSPFLEARLNHLVNAKNELKTFLDKVNSEEYELKVDCPINLELIKLNEPTRSTAESHQFMLS